MKIIERNLQEIGKSLFVSLPKEWTKALNLKKGSKIKIMTSEQGFLSIAPEFTIQEKSRETEIEYDEHFKRRFFREYFYGNEKITIIFRKKISKMQRKEIYSFLKRFITVQIIEETESKIILKSFKIEELSIEECLKRLYFLSLNMLEELSSSDNKVMLKEMRDNMTKFYYLLVMQIRRFFKEGKFTEENQIPILRSLDFRMVAEKMQRIGEIVDNFGKVNNKELIRLIKEIQAYYSKTVLYFMDNNYEKAPIVWSGGENIEKELKKILKQSIKSKNMTLYEQTQDLLQISRYTKEIAALIR